MDYLFQGVIQVFQPVTLVYLIMGVLGGVIFGAIPGLTAALGVTLMLPFTYSMTTGQSISMLMGIYVGGISGGLVASVLLNIPGTPASLVTTFDGAPMARQGRAAQALSLGVFASLIGGIISAAALCVIAPQLAKVALMFGSWEYFAMGIMGLSVVVALSSKNMIKGFISVIIGMLIAMIGLDPISAIPRFTFGFWQLNAGCDQLATLMGLFALSEVLSQINGIHQSREIREVGKVKLLPQKQDIAGKLRQFLSGSVIGTVVGILPGVGQATASLLSYNQARQTSKDPDSFGKGNPDGIIASESANNACCGGALIPMLTLGIPGDQVTAILIGGLVIHGLQPGPLLFTTSGDIVGTVFVSYIVSCVAMYFIMLLLMKVLIKVLKVPMNYLLPIILVMCMIGAFTSNNRIFDCWVLLLVGLMSYILTKCEFPLAPLVLGYVLGPTIETNLSLAIIASKGSILPLASRPIALGLLLMGLAMLLWPTIKSVIQKQKRENL